MFHPVCLILMKIDAQGQDFLNRSGMLLRHLEAFSILRLLDGKSLI
jgi:hypothetical protein